MIFSVIETGPLSVNCIIAGCEETGKGIVIDPGGDVEKIADVVGRHGLRIERVINTHGHFDHVGGNRGICSLLKAQLLIHKEDAPMLGRVSDVSRMYGLEAENSPEPDGYLDDGMEFMVGTIGVKVIHTPGHTRGGCCLYFQSHGIVVTGDTLFSDSIGRTDRPGGSHGQLISSINDKLMILPENTVVWPGHGPETTIGHEKNSNPYLI